jgi:hypothetical protein
VIALTMAALLALALWRFYPTHKGAVTGIAIAALAIFLAGDFVDAFASFVAAVGRTRPEDPP